MTDEDQDTRNIRLLRDISTGFKIAFGLMTSTGIVMILFSEGNHQVINVGLIFLISGGVALIMGIITAMYSGMLASKIDGVKEAVQNFQITTTEALGRVETEQKKTTEALGRVETEQKKTTKSITDMKTSVDRMVDVIEKYFGGGGSPPPGGS